MTSSFRSVPAFRSVLGASASALGLLTASGAWAADAAPAAGDTAIQEVVVTARMRNESLQTVPVAVTAFNEKALADARVEGAADYLGLIPNVSVTESQSVGIAFITIRGISQVRNGESPVSVVVDGVQQVTSRQFNQNLFDVQQIEVLRGPQGALYGRDAIGGAIIITSKPPTNTYQGEGEASYGNGDDYLAQAAVSGPIVKDKLLFRVTGSYHSFGGLLSDTYLNKNVDYLEQYTVRGQLKWIINDRLTADLRLSADHVKGGANNFVYQGAKYDPNHPCFLDPSNPFGGDEELADDAVVILDRDFLVGHGRSGSGGLSGRMLLAAVARRTKAGTAAAGFGGMGVKLLGVAGCGGISLHHAGSLSAQRQQRFALGVAEPTRLLTDEEDDKRKHEAEAARDHERNDGQGEVVHAEPSPGRIVLPSSCRPRTAWPCARPWRCFTSSLAANQLSSSTPSRQPPSIHR